MRPKFITLIILTLIVAAVLFPFSFSHVYLPLLREQNFQLYNFFRSDLYKQTTGFIALMFVFLEMGLTLRKRGIRWKLKLPGSMLLWRSLHIFLGVGLLGIVLIHTNGSMGFNFNTAFLWVFFAVSLSALVGVVAETGIIESPLKYFRLLPLSFGPIAKSLPILTKGPLVRNLRTVWLSLHIFLVSLFFVMLGFHIFLAYYFQ